MKVLTYLEYCKSNIFAQMDFDGWIKSHYNTQAITAIDFYSQPFKPELITELFEGWVLAEYSKAEFGYFKTVINKHIAEIEFSEYYDDGLYQICCTKTDQIIPKPRTLDDFINDCQRAGIELQFKEVTK